MSHKDAAAICRRIDAALTFMGDDDQLRPYILYQLEEVMGGRKHITMADCPTSDLMALLAVVLPTFSRSLAGLEDTDIAPPGKLLTLILGDSGVDNDASTGTD
jgi:hypothetical protein